MPNKTPYLNPLTAIILLVSLTFTLPLQAQKRRTTKKNVTHKEIKPEIDYSEWTDNPICRVMVADSVVVDVNDIWKSLPLPPYMGKLSYEKSTGRLVFENEFGDQRMFSDLEAGGTSAIYRQTLLADKWSEPERITINGGQFDLTDCSCRVTAHLGRIAELCAVNASLSKNSYIGSFEKKVRGIVPVWSDRDSKILQDIENSSSGF